MLNHLKKAKEQKFVFSLGNCPYTSTEHSSFSTRQSSLDGLLARDEP